MTLAQVNTAIETILTGGQSFSIDGVSYTQASLATLRQLRETLMAETSRTTRPLFRAFNFGGMGYGSSGANGASVTPVQMVPE